MIQWHPLAQAARFQRTAWINTFSACSAMQLKGKEMLETSLNQCFWLTEKDKQEYLTWTESCLEATENMQSLIDKSFQEVEKHLSDQPAASASAPKKSSIASLVLAATQPAPKAAAPAKATAPAKAAAPAKKKAPSKRSTTASKSTGEVQVKKEAVTAKSEPAANKKVASPAKKRRAATTKTAKKPVTATKTGVSTKQTSTPAAKSAASDNAAGKEKAAEKQTPAKTKDNSGSVPKQTP